jgi:hypothetical protein
MSRSTRVFGAVCRANRLKSGRAVRSAATARTARFLTRFEEVLGGLIAAREDVSRPSIMRYRPAPTGSAATGIGTGSPAATTGIASHDGRRRALAPVDSA